jgi:uncharacterized membrane protein
MDKRRLALIIGVLLAAAFLRFHHLDAQSFWNDEGNSARIIERPLHLIVEGAAGDIHPPGYYVLLAGWRVFAGFSEFSLRAFSAFASVIVVALIYALGRRFFSPRTALLAALLVAANPFQVYYAQEARMYALLGALAAASMLAFDVWLRSSSRRAATALILLNAAGLYVQYAYPVIMVAQGIAFLIFLLHEEGREIVRHNLRRKFMAFAVISVITLALYAPWLPIMVRQVMGWPRNSGGDSLYSQISLTLTYLMVGSLDLSKLAGAFFVSGALILMWAVLKSPVRVWIWAALPPAMLMVLGLTSPTFLKVLIVANPAWMLLIAGILSSAGRLLRIAGVAGISTLLITSLFGVHLIYTDPKLQRPDYREIAHFIETNLQEGDAIILNAPNQWEVFTYYYDGAAPVYPLPEQEPHEIDAIRGEVEAILADHERVWGVFWGTAEQDPAQVVESTLDMGAYRAYFKWYQGVSVELYAVPDELASEPDIALQENFGDLITLAGYALDQKVYTPGDVILLTLFWRAESEIDARYKVYVHLLNSDGDIVSQQDSEPVGDSRPTYTWGVGETIVDSHGIIVPIDAVSGTYALRTGLYDLFNSESRLYMADGRDGITLEIIVR